MKQKQDDDNKRGVEIEQWRGGEKFLLPHPNAEKLYRDETFRDAECKQKGSVKDWTATELRRRIETSIQRVGYQSVVQKVLKLMEEESIGGELLLAAGKSHLVEKASMVGMSKADRMRLPHVATLIYSTILEADKQTTSASYWSRLETSGQMGQVLCEEYEKSGCPTGALLCRAMEPHSLDMIQFSCICHLEAAKNVMGADEYVCKHVDPSSPFLYKVVSLAPRDDPTTVWSNLIYARSDLLRQSLPAMQTKTNYGSAGTCSRKQRRKERQTNSKRHSRQTCRPSWELLASVDFSQHGSAAPGHWHLNKTSSGDLVPHLGLSETEGDRRETWHGAEDGCPLWWHFIPSCMVHKTIPRRLLYLLEDLNSADREERAN